MCAYVRYASTMAWFVTYTCLLAILLCIVFVTALCSVAWHITYLFFGGRWRCCCLCMKVCSHKELDKDNYQQ